MKRCSISTWVEEKPVEYAGHARTIVNLDDDKYNIHGIYLADATWDNTMDSDIYLNSLMTFDRKKEARRLERLNNIDLLFDFHNFTEFSQKIDYLIKKIGKENIFYKTDNPINYSYKEIYNTITKILKEIDYELADALLNNCTADQPVTKTAIPNLWIMPTKPLETEGKEKSKLRVYKKVTELMEVLLNG